MTDFYDDDYDLDDTDDSDVCEDDDDTDDSGTGKVRPVQARSQTPFFYTFILYYFSFIPFCVKGYLSFFHFKICI